MIDLPKATAIKKSLPPRNLDAIPDREETGQNLPIVEAVPEVILEEVADSVQLVGKRIICVGVFIHGRSSLWQVVSK